MFAKSRNPLQRFHSIHAGPIRYGSPLYQSYLYNRHRSQGIRQALREFPAQLLSFEEPDENALDTLPFAVRFYDRGTDSNIVYSTKEKISPRSQALQYATSLPVQKE